MDSKYIYEEMFKCIAINCIYDNDSTCKAIIIFIRKSMQCFFFAVLFARIWSASYSNLNNDENLKKF